MTGNIVSPIYPATDKSNKHTNKTKNNRNWRSDSASEDYLEQP